MGSRVYDQILSEFTDYRSKTTFWDDFSIAEFYEDLEPGAIQRTYDAAMTNWKNDYEYLTELVLVLNHKIWQWSDADKTKAELYDKLWRKADEYAMSHLKDDELTYFLEVTD